MYIYIYIYVHHLAKVSDKVEGWATVAGNAGADNDNNNNNNNNINDNNNNNNANNDDNNDDYDYYIAPRPGSRRERAIRSNMEIDRKV